jgi:hypothetical protein
MSESTESELRRHLGAFLDQPGACWEYVNVEPHYVCKFCRERDTLEHKPDCPWCLAMEASVEPEEPTPKKRRAFISNLEALFQRPIEDGVTHPAEAEVRAWLDADRSAACDWLSRAIRKERNSPAMIIRIIGRQDFKLAGQWGLCVADEGLQHSDAEIREAAVRALEAWGGSDALSILRRHNDSEPWLNDYVRQVVRDLSKPGRIPDAALDLAGIEGRHREVLTYDIIANAARFGADKIGIARVLKKDHPALLEEVRRLKGKLAEARTAYPPAAMEKIDEQAATIARLEKAVHTLRRLLGAAADLLWRGPKDD